MFSLFGTKDSRNPSDRTDSKESIDSRKPKDTKKSKDTRNWQKMPNMEGSEFSKEFLNEVIGLLPLPLKELIARFEQFKVNSQQILEKVYSQIENHYKVQELDSDVINKRVFEVAESENACKLDQLAQEKIEEFLTALQFQMELDFSVISDFIKTRILETDNVLQEIIVWKIGVKGELLQPDLQKINQIIETCFKTAELYWVCLFEKYQISEQILSKKEQTEFLCTLIYQQFKENFRPHEKFLSRKLMQCLAKCVVKINYQRPKKSKSNTRDSLGIDKYATENRNQFIQFVIDELKFEPSQVFIWNSLQQIEMTADSLYEDSLELKEDLELFKKFSPIFDSYYKTRAINIFDNRFEPNYLLTVVNIILLTDYNIHDETTWRKHCYPKLKTLTNNFLYPRVDNSSRGQIETVLFLLNTPGEHRAQLNGLLAKELESWNKITKELESEILLITLFSIFIYFSDSVREEAHREYKSYFRKMIVTVYKILLAEEQTYRAYQILIVLEVLYQKYGFKGTEPPLETEIKEKILRLAKTKGTSESLMSLENFFGGATVQIHDLGAHTPKKFYVERISKVPQIRSKHIIITCSGFTMEYNPKSEDWKNFIDTYPLCEIHSVHYESQNPFGVVATALKLTNSAFKMVRQIIKPTQIGDGTWGRAYEEATHAGKYLAHVIQRGDYYKDKIVSLVGYSLGTKVVVSCLKELDKLKCNDRVYEVLLMGGVVNKGDFNGTFPNVVAHELISCYTAGDWVLKYVLKVADSRVDPVGISSVACKAKNFRNENCTQYIKNHHDYLPKVKKLCLRLGFNEDVYKEEPNKESSKC